MFEKYLLVDDSLRNVDDGTYVTGFCVDVRIAYYRGLGLSMVSADLEVNGERIPREHITFSVHGNSYPLDEMSWILDDRWGFTEAATLTVAHPGGLATGEHTVHLTEWLRVSYGGVSESHCTKQFILV